MRSRSPCECHMIDQFCLQGARTWGPLSRLFSRSSATIPVEHNTNCREPGVSGALPISGTVPGGSDRPRVLERPRRAPSARPFAPEAERSAGDRLPLAQRVKDVLQICVALKAGIGPQPIVLDSHSAKDNTPHPRVPRADEVTLRIIANVHGLFRCDPYRSHSLGEDPCMGPGSCSWQAENVPVEDPARLWECRWSTDAVRRSKLQRWAQTLVLVCLSRGG